MTTTTAATITVRLTPAAITSKGTSRSQCQEDDAFPVEVVWLVVLLVIVVLLFVVAIAAVA